MLFNDYINKLDYDEDILIREACDELDNTFNDLPIFCESVDEYYLFSENVASGFIAFVKKCVEAVKKFFADVAASISAAFEKKDIRENLAKFRKLSAAEQKDCLKALKEKKITDLDVAKFEKAVKAIRDELEKAYSKYENMKFKDSAARDAYVNGAIETAMKKLKALDEYMDSKMDIPVDTNNVVKALEAGWDSKNFDAMIKDITDSMEKIGQKETTDSEKDVDKTSGRKSFVLAFKNLGRTVRTGMAKHGKAVIGIGAAIGVAALAFAGSKTETGKKALDAAAKGAKTVVDTAKSGASTVSKIAKNAPDIIKDKTQVVKTKGSDGKSAIQVVSSKVTQSESPQKLDEFGESVNDGNVRYSTE